MGSNPTAPKLFFQKFTLTSELLGNAPSKGHHSRYITLFLKGTSSVNSFFELIRRFCEGLHHFLR